MGEIISVPLQQEIGKLQGQTIEQDVIRLLQNRRNAVSQSRRDFKGLPRCRTAAAVPGYPVSHLVIQDLGRCNIPMASRTRLQILLSKLTLATAGASRN